MPHDARDAHAHTAFGAASRAAAGAAAGADAERTIFAGPASQWTNVGSFFACAVLAGVGVALQVFEAPGQVTLLFILAAVLIAFLIWLRTRFVIYRVTTCRIEVERGWLTKRIDNVDLFRIKDVSLRIGIFGRLAGIGDITITASDADSPVQTLRGVPRPRLIYEHLKRAAVAADQRRGVLHVET